MTAIALGANAVWGGGPDGSKTSTTIAAPSASPPEEPTAPTDPPDPTDPTVPADATVDYTGTPTQTWRMSAADLMSGDPTAFVALASPDPLERPARQETVVVTAGTGSQSSIIGLDRATGTQSWRIDLEPSTAATCKILGTGASTVCVIAGSDSVDGTYRVLTLDSGTGAVQGEDTVGFLPFTVTELDGDLVLAGSTISTGALHATRGTPVDLDARWHASSPDGYVPATEYFGGFVVSDDMGWSYVSGATMKVDLGTGEAESTPSSSGTDSGPWPGGTLLESADLGTDAPHVTVTAPGGVPFTADGRAWTRLGASDVMASVVGVGDTAFDPQTGAARWSAVSDPAALWTSYTAVDDLVLQQTWWEESVMLSAFDTLTGELRWTSGTRSSWLLTRAGEALLADTSFGIEALHLTTGEALWALDYTDLVTGDSYMYAAAHSIAGTSMVTTFDRLVTGYNFD